MKNEEYYLNNLPPVDLGAESSEYHKFRYARLKHGKPTVMRKRGRKCMPVEDRKKAEHEYQHKYYMEVTREKRRKKRQEQAGKRTQGRDNERGSFNQRGA